MKEAPPELVTRYRRLYSYLAQHDAVIPLVISECGQNGGGGLVSQTDFVDDYTWYDNQLMRDPFVVGCAAPVRAGRVLLVGCHEALSKQIDPGSVVIRAKSLHETAQRLEF